MKKVEEEDSSTEATRKGDNKVLEQKGKIVLEARVTPVAYAIRFTILPWTFLQ